MNEEEFLDILESICNHPKTYTITGSFYEVVIFLEGFALGANVGSNQYHSKFTPFLKWLVKKLKLNNLILTWKDFYERTSNDEVALRELNILYKEYVNTLPH